MLATPAGLAGLAVILEERTATILTAMTAALYVSGGVCWIASLAFRLTVVPWAAEQTVTVGDVPNGFAANDFDPNQIEPVKGSQVQILSARPKNRF